MLPRRSLLLTILVAALAVNPLCGELRAHYTPERLAEDAHLIVIATQISPTRLRVSRTLKGKWHAQEIEVPGLAELKRENPWAGKEATPELTDQCLLFLNVRWKQPAVVYNGVFRFRKDGALLGYQQYSTPGPYHLNYEPAFRSLDPVLEQIKKCADRIPGKLDDLMRKVAAAGKHNELGEPFEELRRLAWVDDIKVIEFLAKEMTHAHEVVAQRLRTGPWDERAQFLNNKGLSLMRVLEAIPHPMIDPLLENAYVKARNPYLLRALGERGNANSVHFLERQVRGSQNREASRWAFDAMCKLHSTVAEQDAAAADTVRDAVFGIIDDMPGIFDHVKFQPAVLTHIQDPGSVARLQKMLSLVGDGNPQWKRHLLEAIQTCTNPKIKASR